MDLKQLINKRKNELLKSRPYLTYLYFKDLFYAKSLTKGDKIKDLQRDFQKYSGRTWVILQYQRICDPSSTSVAISEGEYLTEKTFSMQMHTLRDTCNIISLSTLISYLENNETPPLGSVVITFDDGLLDGYLKAVPLLLDLEIPATFAISTAYIGTKLTFWDNLLGECLNLFSTNNIPLPPLPSISEESNRLLATTFDKNNLPTPKTTESIITLYLSLNGSKRMNLINDLEMAIKSYDLSLPEWNEFMDWDHILDLQKAHFEIISKLHSGTPAFFLKASWLEKELENSFQVLSDYEIPISSVISLPQNSYNESTLDILSKFKVRYALAGEKSPPPELQKQPVKLLPRKVLLEGNSNQRDLFLLNLFT